MHTSWTTIVSAPELASTLPTEGLHILDCRFRLDDTGRGRRSYGEAHIPGACYAHLDEDLSGPVVPGVTGRHPLPDPYAFEETLRRWGISNGDPIVCYDDAGGAIAARLWWMMNWIGHREIAVLDGGFPAWTSSGFGVSADRCSPSPGSFSATANPALLSSASDVAGIQGDPGRLLIDARARERFLGEIEPIDPVAGHIPGAVSLPFRDNLDGDGLFLSREAMRDRFLKASWPGRAEDVTVYCGSGVTAAHNLLAIRHAGLGMARLYSGSWSEWITDPSRPVDR